MKQLPISFKKYGFDFQQVERTPKAAIYAQRDHGTLMAYEVVKIRQRKASSFVVASKSEAVSVPEREIYPSDRQWGLYGWTYSLFGGKLDAETALQQAREKLVSI